MHKPTIFVLSYERPIYLWAALDSLYRGTFTPVRVILVDSGSRDPLVHRVIDSFDRRGLFERVLRLPENDWDWVEPFFERELAGVGDVFFYMESDVVIAPAADCWVGRMLRVMERDPRLAMLGSRIDKSDFIDPAAVEARWRRPLTAGELAQL
jgi:GT2 family glycosyltransferase